MTDCTFEKLLFPACRRRRVEASIDCGEKLGFLEANIAYALAREDTAEQAAALMARYLSPPAGRIAG